MPTLDPVALHHARELFEGRGLAVLAAWVLGNVLGSGYYVSETDRRTPAHHFHLMNVCWGLVNAGIAAWGVLNLYRAVPAGLALATEAAAHHHDERLFLFNAGLDVLYVATGFWLARRAAAPGAGHPARLAGFGRSLKWQGGFLLAFDLAMWAGLFASAGPLRAAGV
ncbi:DUF6992 family protein [Hymenobacter caeli]|uniref:Uncharacterized protein n=1 Tax=Hymenobacter caeli TaxID=2735894 RepID=A0ABX2FN97_9BACT|nr:hypothetical protein [Hymenobacter caeli]NRT18318.1 hypothetical protein [Hymenobacter caeli]